MQTNLLINSKWEDYIKEIPDNSVDLVFTDPPYNVSQKSIIWRDYRQNDGFKKDSKVLKGRIGNINMDFGEWDYTFSPKKLVKEAVRVLNDNGSLIVFSSDTLLGDYYKSFTEFGLKTCKYLVWIKDNPVPQFRKVNYRSSTELILWASKGSITQKNPNWIFLKQQEMLGHFCFPICSGKERLDHPTQKPLQLCKEIIKRHCRPGGLVLDCFSGVGTIPMAAYQLGREYIGIEMDENYHNQALNRFNNHKTTVEEENDSFEQLKF